MRMPMRMAELSRESGVPITTIKHYLRERVLPPGQRIGHNQARYGEGHVKRLRLVRALMDIGGLTIAEVAEILAAMNSKEISQNEIFGAAAVTQSTLPLDDDSESAQWAREQVRTLVERFQWQVEPDGPECSALAKVLVAVHEVEPVWLDHLDEWAELMAQIADVDIEALSGLPDLLEQIEIVVVANTLGDAMHAALRRIVQASRSASLFGPKTAN